MKLVTSCRRKIEFKIDRIFNFLNILMKDYWAFVNEPYDRY
jgi:hypothetical protein